MKKLYILIFVHSIVFALLALGGCASRSAGSFPESSARTAFDVRFGRVVSTRPVEIEGEASVIGTFGGALIGRAVGLGDEPFFSSERRLGGAIGTVGGAVAGEAIERRLRSEEALEIVVRLDRADVIAVVQQSDVLFSPGDRVQVLFGTDGSTRVQAP